MTLPPPAVTLADVKAYLRIDTADEDTLLDLLIGAATSLCEQFLRQALVDRAVTETLAGSSRWQRLSLSPVRAITAVDGVPADGYASDIDTRGDGWVRAAAPVTVQYTAGLAADAAGLPIELRQGIVRLVAHLHAHRDDADRAGPPAAVSALWQPWRRMRLA